VNAEFYENVIPLPLHLILGMGKLLMDIAEHYCREKDFRDRLENPSAILESEIDLITALKTYENRVVAHDVALESLNKTKRRKRTATNDLDRTIKVLTELERKAKREMEKSKAAVLIFDGDTLRTYRNVINSILVHRKINKGLRAALVGSVVGKMFRSDIMTKLVNIMSTCSAAAGDNFSVSVAVV